MAYTGTFFDCTNASAKLGTTKVGAVELARGGTTSAEIKEVVINTKDLTCFGAYPSELSISSGKRVEGSINWLCDSGSSAAAFPTVTTGTTKTFVKVASAGVNFETENAIITDVSASIKTDGVVEGSLSFKTSGAYTLQTGAIS